MVEHWSPKPGVGSSSLSTRANRTIQVMAGIKGFVEEAVDELLNKVSWPTWSELQSSSVIVLIASFIIAGMIYLMDVGFGQIMDFVYTTIFG